MKNKLLIIGIFAFALLQSNYSNAFPCLKGNKQVTTKIISGISSYTDVENFTSADVKLSVGAQETKIEGESNLIDIFEFSITNNKLTIKTKDKKCFTSHSTITIYLTNTKYSSIYNYGSGDISSTATLNFDLKNIKNSGSGNIVISGTSSGELNLNNNGSGDFKFSGNANTLIVNNHGSGDLSFSGEINIFNAKNSGSGNLEFSGNADKITLINAGSGNIEAVNMIVKTADISNAGSGNIAVNVTNSIDASLMGSGNIRVKGTPTYISKTDTGSGRITNY